MRRFGFVAVLVALQSWPANAACGDRGRPGYRGPDHHCVSWLSLAKGACGCPPTAACTPEHLRAGAEKVAKLRCLIRKLSAH